ncbi:MAG: efflux RND transporter permease subunit [Candidatus Omnitrophica bacterium]|nr:efflux RND transporter permease subunit [Candidatus Omnitrophota bacterium]MDD5573829.1 efflux RND transporter permease subunit [Candidatus Omnitrophota bacterium]
MSLPEFGVKKPVSNLMIFSAIVILAFYSLTRIGIDIMPEIEPPIISVIAAYPGANPQDVEIKVTEPLENQLATTPGLEKITSRSMEGASVISLKFKWGTNLDEASNDIRDRIEQAKRLLPDIPDEMDNPFLYKFNTANIPIVFFGITANQTYPELYDLIDNSVGDALRQLPGVGTVNLFGGLQRQINVWIGRERLEGYGFSILDIQDALSKENVTQPVGNIKMGLTDYLLRLPGEFATPDEINSVILGKSGGKIVYLKEVARIEDGFKEVTMVVRINRNPGLLMQVQKQTGTNTVEVAERVKKKIAELEKTLPSDVKMQIIFDTSEDIINSVNTLASSVWVAVILVIFVVWFFLRQATPSMIIVLTIPFSLLITFIYLFLSGKTINTISLSSVAIASGMVVDNAIVVVDNIHRRLEKGNRAQEAAVFGANEMFLAIAASTMTTVVVFLPMLFITGVVGIMFGELAIIVIVTLLASLFTAVTFSPMLCAKLLRIGPASQKTRSAQGFFARFYDFSEKIFTSWENFYALTLGRCLRHRKFTLIGFSVVFACSLLLMPFIGNEFIPEEDSGDVRVTVELPIGTRVEESDKVAKRIEEIFVSEVPERRFLFVRSGQMAGMGRTSGQSSGSHVIFGGAKLVSKTERKRSVKEVGQIVRERISRIPGVLKVDITTGNPLGQMITGTGGKSIQVEVIGHSFEETDTVANQLKELMEKVPGAVDVSISRELKRPELIVKVDREKIGALGLDMNTVSESIKTYIEGSVATKYREKGETYDIYVRLEESGRTKIEDVENLSITSPYSGKQIRLSNIAEISEAVGPVEIERQNRERVVRVSCNTFKRSSGKVIEDIKKEMQKMVLPADIYINFGGEAEEQTKAFRDLALLLVLGIILVYMVMAAQFESLLDPFIVMFAVPFTFTGVILGLLATHNTLNVISFLGIVMLMGIVVNNAIVLISYINILRARGYALYDAITQSGKDRLRPVLMTTITTLVGLLPLAMSRGEGSETWQPLGVTMLGGLLVSTFITMLFVPTLYAVFEKRLKKNGEAKPNPVKQSF